MKCKTWKNEEPSLILPLSKAWSEEARSAAVVARGRGAKAHIDTPTETRAHAVDVEGRMKRPPTEGINLTKDERPIDYGHVNELLKEKYGPTRGEHTYQGMIDLPGASKGLHFVAGQQIQKEKLSMMNAMGKTGPLENHDYQGLHSSWMDGMERTRRKNNSISYRQAFGPPSAGSEKKWTPPPSR